MHRARAQVCRLVLHALWLGCLPLAAAMAVEVDGLYQAEVPVTTRDRPERAEAFEQALKQVLVRVTGERAAAEREEAKPILDTSARYVRQFRYEQVKDDKEFPYRLDVVFDGQALERAVAAQGLPVWGRRRPGIVVWLGVQDERRRYLVGGDSGEQAKDAMETAATQRGIPLVFPLLDLDDQRAVTFADVAGGFQDNILAASDRYRPDGVLVGRVTRLQGDFWRAQWRLHFGGQWIDWQTEGPRLNQVLGSGVERLADELAMRLATSAVAGPVAGTLVSVRGVASLKDFVIVRNYLRELAPVSAVRPHRFAADRIELVVEMRGDPRDLGRIIGLGDVLAREPEPTPPAPLVVGTGVETPPVQQSSARLFFRLVR